MTPDRKLEIAAYFERADQSIQSARDLAIMGRLCCFSCVLCGVFTGATAILLSEGLDFSKHSGVIAAIHQRFVKTGKMSKELGKDLNWLFEIRNLGDYGGTVHVSSIQAEQAIQAAERILVAIRSLLP